MKSTKINFPILIKPEILRNFALLTIIVLALFAYSCSDDDDDDNGGEEPEEKELVLEEIAMGARIHGTNGINFGPDGNLYIASFYGQEVVSMNKQTGEIVHHLWGGQKRAGPG